MKLYDCTTAPSPRRTRIFIAEKGLDIESIQVDLRKGEQFSDEFKKINPRCTVPVLELDDGTTITENIGIACYLEELQPRPALMGQNPAEKADVLSWNSRIEFEGLFAVAESFRNHAKGFKEHALTGPNKITQIPELVMRGRERTQYFFVELDKHLGGSEYICGEQFTLADITAFVTVDFAGWIKLQIDASQVNLKRWFEQVSHRASISG